MKWTLLASLSPKSQRGGAVSGLGGHNAAMAVLESR